MARPKKEESGVKVAIIGKNKIEYSESVADSECVQIVIPKDMPYPQIRKALEFAALRVK